MTTQHTGPLASLVAELRTEAVKNISPENIEPDDDLFEFYAGRATGLRFAAARIEKLLAEMCSVALERCEPTKDSYPNYCDKHGYMEWGEWVEGTFTQQEAAE